MAKAARRHLPNDAEDLADILHGLGELDARGDGTLLLAMIGLLNRRRPRADITRLLNAAARRDGEHKWPATFGSISFGQWITRAALDWETLNRAISHQGHPVRYAAWRYGFAFVSTLALALQPRAMHRWLRTHAADPAVVVVGTMALEMQLPWKKVPGGARSLLISGTPALRCIAAAALLEPPWQRDTPLSFAKCAGTLKEGGISSGDIVWIMGWRLKQLVHARYRVEDHLKTCTGRRRHVAAFPEAATGGSRNAAAELAMLDARLGQATQSQTDLGEALEAILNNLATIWPPDGLTPAQRIQMSKNFVDTPEIRYRLAMKLPAGADRATLLRANVDQLSGFLGLRTGPSDGQDAHFHRDETRFERIDSWTAQSMVALHATDSVGVGRGTARLLQPLAEAANTMARPFAAGRRPMAWSAVVGRAAFAHRFALSVVAAVAAPDQETVALLNEMALRYSFAVLAMSRHEAGHDRLFDHLTTQAVDGLRQLPAPETERLRWAQADALPDFARALALWSSPTLVEDHPALAGDLFGRVALPPLSQRDLAAQLGCMLCLLDTALATAATTGNDVRRARLVELRDKNYKPWRSVSEAWAGAALLMSAALAADGPERRELLADDVLRNTACRRLIDSGG